MIYTDFFEYNTDFDTKIPLLRSFLFSCQLKPEDIITTGQYINYKTFSTLTIGPLLKSFFDTFHKDLRDTSGERMNFVSAGIIRFELIFIKGSNIHF